MKFKVEKEPLSRMFDYTVKAYSEKEDLVVLLRLTKEDLKDLELAILRQTLRDVEF